MKESVVIKGFNNGIVVVLSPEVEFEQLKTDVAEKFKDSAKFLGKERMALKFSGRELSDNEKEELIDIINENSDLQIVCVLEDNPELDDRFKKKLEEKVQAAADIPISDSSGVFYKGTLRSGTYLNFPTSVIVLGDINAGATIESAGNIIVIGSVKGNVFAGSKGDSKSVVFALDLKPVQIRIAEIIARAPDEQSKNNEKEAKIAFVEDGNIYIEPLTKKVLQDIYS